MQVTTNRYIMMSQDRERIDRAVQASGGKLKIVEDLPVCDGVLIEAAPGYDPDLFKGKIPGLSVVPERKLHWIEPVAVEAAPKHTMAFDGDKVGAVAGTLHMDQVWAQGFTGKGVGVAVLDSGIVEHADFDGRLAVFKDFTDPSKDGQPWDAAGHGSHVAGDAAGSGKSSNGEHRGPAYEATILGLKVGDQWGPDESAALKAVQWAIDHKDEHNIRLMNMSFGGPTQKDPLDDPLVRAVHKAADAGITTFMAAGNEGPGKSTIGSPGYAPRAITVGASDDRRTASRDDDRLARFSSRGPTPDGQQKPDIVSPGVNIVGPDASSRDRYVSMSGTSMASPVAMGVAATWLQANPDLTSEQLKQIAKESATPLTQPELTPNDQGAGLIDGLKGLEKALALKAAAAAAGSPAAGAAIALAA
ncbi:MAG: S8 family peptidase [Armatimonadetes bacterium]|nr:S8 family peptidase [Armatimonadota bacterium]